MSGRREASRGRGASTPQGDDRPRILYRTPDGDVPLSQLDEPLMRAIAERCRDLLYVRGTELVRVVGEDQDPLEIGPSVGKQRIVLVTEPIARVLLDHAAAWMVEYLDKSGRLRSAERWTPLAVVKAFLGRGEWPDLRRLDGVVTAPTMRPDGSILETPGYDDTTRLLYLPRHDYPTVPADPTDQDVRDSLVELLQPFAEFEFDTDADNGALLAAAFTIAARPAIKGPAPLFGVMASSFGTGKTLIAEAVTLGMTGQLPETMPPVGGRGVDAETEMRKRLTATLIDGPRVVVIDNVPDGHDFESKSFAALLTTTEWTDRVLGKSERTTLPHFTVWFLTGCNYRLWGDLVRRSLSIALFTEHEDPHLRVFTVKDLPAHVSARHPNMLVAALTILRAYHLAGRPAHGGARLGRFEAWDDLVRGAVIWATTIGRRRLDPLDTQTRLREGSPDRNVLGDLLAAAHGAFGSQGLTTKEIVNRCSAHAALRDAIEEANCFDRTRPSARLLGNFMRVHQGRVVGGLRIVNAGTHQRRVRWRVERVGGGESGESGESSAAPSNSLPRAPAPACAREEVEGRGNGLTGLTGLTESAARLPGSDADGAVEVREPAPIVAENCAPHADVEDVR